MMYYTAKRVGGCGRPFLFIKSFSVLPDRRSQGRNAERVAPPLPPSPRDSGGQVNVKQMTQGSLDHVLGYMIHYRDGATGRRNAPSLFHFFFIPTAQGRRLGAQRMVDGSYFDSLGAQARFANEKASKAHGT